MLTCPFGGAVARERETEKKRERGERERETREELAKEEEAIMRRS